MGDCLARSWFITASRFAGRMSHRRLLAANGGERLQIVREAGRQHRLFEGNSKAKPTERVRG